MIKEIEGDLFMHLEGRVPVHCIAADHRMGAGIAVPMARRFALHEALDGYGALLDWPSCVYANGVLNLVTKRLSFHKPELADFARALDEMNGLCRRYGITKLVMPQIGCGLDRLDWADVLTLLQEKVGDLDVLVCTPAHGLRFPK